MSKKIIQMPAVLEMIGMKRSWLYAEMTAGRFPRPVKLG
ncbi:MAG: AlpA family phage regulatory protein [Rhodobacteraceae bacterium]|nr:AlpA family phage regulatory protein [Paracoccaceae bacterium]